MVLVSCFLKAAILLFQPATPPTREGPLEEAGSPPLVHDATIHSRGQQRQQAGLQDIRYAGDFQIWAVTLLGAVQSEGSLVGREAVQDGVQNLLQLWQVYIGETKMRLETRLKEHQEGVGRGHSGGKGQTP